MGRKPPPDPVHCPKTRHQYLHRYRLRGARHVLQIAKVKLALAASLGKHLLQRGEHQCQDFGGGMAQLLGEAHLFNGAQLAIEFGGRHDDAGARLFDFAADGWVEIGQPDLATARQIQVR